jgi:hypothetical protein
MSNTHDNTVTIPHGHMHLTAQAVRNLVHYGEITVIAPDGSGRLLTISADHSPFSA